ncbi:MAG: HD domain-containing protein [Spirochaetes bacterium]|nr:HD domain-containing protein [Spirochaetota bacterium]
MPRNMIYQYVKDITAGRIASGFNHCNRVYHLARELDDDYDDDVLYAACFLHDLIVGTDEQKYLQSAEKAEQILHEVGFPPEKINPALEAIRTHFPGATPGNKEAKMLHDANLLDRLGAIGLVRLSIGAFFWYHLKTLNDVLNLLKEIREQTKYLISDKAKEMAKDKIKFMDEAIIELENEKNL